MDRIADYDTISDTREAEITLKGSRFIGIVMPCPSEGDIQPNLERVSQKYRDATHYCWAAVYDGSFRHERSSDNGEPSGTAGKPILFNLKGSGLSDIMCVVVRYFGGTLLGTGGLVHAYGETSKLALEGVARRTRRACAVYRFTLDYGYYSQFENKMRDLMAKRPDCEYSAPRLRVLRQGRREGMDTRGQGRGVRAQDHRPDGKARQALEDGRRVHLTRVLRSILTDHRTSPAPWSYQ